MGLEDTNGLTNIVMPSLKQKKTIYDVKTCNSFDHSQTNEIKNLLENYSDFFSDVPSRTECITHKI